MGRALGLGLLLVVVVGAGLRVYRAGGESLWLDEACSVEAAVQPLSGIVAYTREDVHPPLYYFLLHYWIPIAGSSETALRMLSVVFSTLTILALYRLAAWLFGAPTGLVAALLLAVSPFHLAAAQEARMYALLGFLSLWSMFELARLLDPSHARRPVVFAGYVLTTALMLYTHVYGFFVLAAQALFLAGLALWSRPVLAPRWKRILLAQSLAFVLFLPWFQVFLEQLFHVQKNFWIPPAGAGSLAETVAAYAGGPALAPILTFFVLLAVLFDSRTRWSGLLAVWIASLVLLPFAMSMFSAPIFLAKYAIAGSLPFLILAARGITLVPVRPLAVVVAIAVVAVSGRSVRDYYATLTKDDWRAMAAKVGSLARPGDVVIFNQPYGQAPFDYYSRRDDLLEFRFLPARDGLTTRSMLEMLKVLARRSERVWLVLSSVDPLSPLLVRELEATGEIGAHVRERGIESYLFVWRGSERGAEAPSSRRPAAHFNAFAIAASASGAMICVALFVRMQIVAAQLRLQQAASRRVIAEK